jgi:hypothetical protein
MSRPFASRHSVSFAALASVLSVGFVVVAASCSSSDDVSATKDSGTAGDTSSPNTTFSPTGCAFTVGAIGDQLGAVAFPPFDANDDSLGSAATPKHVRVGLGGGVVAGKQGYADPSTTMGVIWQTDPSTKATKLRYGDADGSFTTTVEGISFLEAQDPDNHSGPPDGIRYHEAYVCGLTPGRTVYYQVGGGPAGKEVWSATGSYTLAPAKGGADPVTIGIAGDARDSTGRSTQPVWKAIMARMASSGAHAITFSGDFVDVGIDRDQWETWNTATDVGGTSVFVAMTPGNHENEQITYYANAMMPGAIGANYERYASFDYGPVHVVELDDYDGIVAAAIDDNGYKDEVVKWIDADLAAADANRANVPWIVTFHHHPFYSSTTQTERAAERANVRSALQSIYDAHHVDLDLAGHDHFYERSKPITADAVVTTGGTTYVICAGAGADAYHTVATDKSAKIVEYAPTDSTGAYVEGLYGIMTATKTKLEVKVYKMDDLTATTITGDTVVDDLTLSR